MRYVAVVVTYNRLEMLKRNIECLQNQTVHLDKIYIINNCSTDQTSTYLETCKSDIITVVSLNENIGGAGGFHYGLSLAYQEGADWIWAMDDDAFPDKDALKMLIECSQRLGERACYWSNCNKDSFAKPYKEVNSWVFVGVFINRKIIKAVGLPRKDFFIYHDDEEYAFRMKKAGVPIYKVRDSLIEHKSALGDIYFQIPWFGRTIDVAKMPKANWRLYYLVRNDILRFSYKQKEKYYMLFIKNGIRFLKVLFFSPSQLGVFLKAYVHGVIGKTGKIMSP